MPKGVAKPVGLLLWFTLATFVLQSGSASMSTELLETFDNPHPNRDYVIEHLAPEFTSVCPKTSQPDFATIILNYVPNTKCVELKSYKLYLQSFRDKGIFYEDVTNCILNDLVACLQPRSMSIVAKFTARGGISSTITAKHEAKS